MVYQNRNILDNASQITNVAWDSINGMLTAIIERLPFVLAGLLAAAVFFAAGRLFRSIFLAATGKVKLDARLRLLFSRFIVVVCVIFGILTALTIIVPSFRFGDLVAGVGLTTFALGFATKDILNNFISGVLILWQQPFKIGDQIFLDKVQGRVEYIGVRATSLRKDDGDLVLVPNGEMYSSTLTIRGAGTKRRMALDLALSYEDDISVAKELIHDALVQTEGVVTEPPPKVFVTDLTSDGVMLTINFWLNTFEARPREVLDRASTAIVSSVTKAGIEPYPPNSVVVRSAETN